MNIPKTGRPKWATHFMYQFKQVGCAGYWLGEKEDVIQSVRQNGELGTFEIVREERIKEYLAGEYSLTVKRLLPITLENK